MKSHDSPQKRDRERQRLKKQAAKKRRKPISAAIHLSRGV
jgi:hypothetical protein